VDYKLSPDTSENYTSIGDNIWRVYRDDIHIRDEFYTGFRDRLRYVERYSNGKKIKSIFYDDYGCVSMIRSYDSDNPDYYPRENYYTTDRLLCLQIDYRYNKEDKKNEPEKIIVFDRFGNAEKECNSNVELVAYCLDQIMVDASKFYMLVDESGLYVRTHLLTKNNNVIKTCVVHNIFLENPKDLSSSPQRYYKDLCEYRNDFDAIIFLTMAERMDFINKYPDFDQQKAFVIPHPYPHNIVRTDFADREHHTAVIISRFDPMKRIEHAIAIFKIVVKFIPEAKLEIYGFGTAEKIKNYQDLIERLELQNNVFLKGVTHDPEVVFGKAACFMMTSAAEGLPLTLIESVSNGCPAFSYDIKYGPSEVIVDGITGGLVPDNDWAAFGLKLIAFFENKNLQRQYSENCYADARRFSKEIFLERWGSLMGALSEMSH
jgi:poly(glycerol-phosphate) alpha-glucosyltransferase